MRTLKSGSSYLTVIISKSEEPISLDLDFKGKMSDSRVIYANKSGKVKGNNILISPEETMVVEWK